MRDPRIRDPRTSAQTWLVPSRRYGPRPGPRLPAELIAEIVGHITDKATLAICARVASVFCHPAQKQFFSHTTLYFESFLNHYARDFKHRPAPPEHTPKAFYTLLKRSPHLARHIRKLSVCVGIEFARKEERQCLNKLIPLLGELRALAFPQNGDDFQGLMTNRANFTKAMYLPPLTQSQTRNLVELDLGAFSDCQVPDASYFRKLTGLRRLSLACAFDTESLLPQKQQQVSMTLGRRPLESLTLCSGRFSFAMALLTSPSFPFEMGGRLRTLHLEPFEFYDRGPIGQIVGLCPNLEEYSQVADWDALAPYHSHSGAPLGQYKPECAPPHLGLLRNLRRITLRGTISSLPVSSRTNRRVDGDYWTVDKFGHHLQWMADMLNSVPMNGQSRVKEIKIIMDLDKYFATEVAVMDWRMLEQVIHPQRFRHLKRVDLEIRVAPPLNDDTGRVYPTPLDILGRKDYLYGLKRSGIFRMNIIPNV